LYKSLKNHVSSILSLLPTLKSIQKISKSFYELLDAILTIVLRGKFRIILTR
jgi:hypothetical protein